MKINNIKIDLNHKTSVEDIEIIFKQLDKNQNVIDRLEAIQRKNLKTLENFLNDIQNDNEENFSLN